MHSQFTLLRWLLLVLAVVSFARAEERVLEVTNIQEWAKAAAGNGCKVRVAPGVYRMSDYLTEAEFARIQAEVPTGGKGRPTVRMLAFSGSDNTFDCTGVVLEIQTELYPKLPYGYTRCVFVGGNRNTIRGLVIRTTGPDQGSNGNLLAVFGENNTLEDLTLQVRGSSPYGYGDLLGKGGPNIVPLKKQSGIQVMGSGTTLRRCKVFSRAFGHCFYIQGGDGVRIEDCYAEGSMRSTADMLRDTSGPAFDHGFRSVYENRDGRFLITAGYMKSLSEDGFRTYGSAGTVTLVNCTAVNTRAGFEVNGKEEAKVKTVMENCQAVGCERSFLIGSNVVARRCRGDANYGPLLYLRGGHGSDLELELTGAGSQYTVHALATIAGEDHRVRLSGRGYDSQTPAVPIMLGFGMPGAAEMASPIRPAKARNITLVNELAAFPLISSEQVESCTVETAGKRFEDAALRKSP